MSGITTVRDKFDYLGSPARTVADAVDLLARDNVNCAGNFVGLDDNGLAIIDLTFATRNLPRVTRLLADSLV